MKKRIVWLIAVLLAPVMVAYASPAHADAGVSIQLPGFGLSVGPGGVGLNIGLPWVVASAPVPAPVPAPAYAYPVNSYEEVVTEEAPEFVHPPELGFYVAVGVPYDLFFYNNSYWIYRGNIWYNSAYYNGPWNQIYYTNIPYVFNRFPFERIRHYRDSYYGRYQRSGAWDGYAHFRPGYRDGYRGGSDRGRHDYARPRNQGQTYRQGLTYRNSPDARPLHSNPQGTGRGYTTNGPTGHNRDYGANNAYSRLSGTTPINTARPAYSRPNGTMHRYDNRSAQIRPSGAAPTARSKPVYTRPDSNGHYAGNRSSYTRQNARVQPSNGKYAYSRTNNSGQTAAVKTVYSRTNSSGQGNKGNEFNYRPNRPDSVNRGWQGKSR